ncbi:MAG: transcriptional regulator with XRE-family HTH domain, partial [Planctomycetota bacterium]
MARREEKKKALALRSKGMSYSQIKERLGISKSTLSYWLRDHSLSPERISELRDHSPRRIERYRNTMAKKRHERERLAREVIGRKIGVITDREEFIAGLFLYWAEGLKSGDAKTTLSNTDPSMLVFYLRWLGHLGIAKEVIRIRLQLYVDMDIERETTYWSETLEMPRDNFRKPYVKKSDSSNRNYTRKFDHGTCEIIVSSRPFCDIVLQGVEYIRAMYGSVDNS